MAENVLEELHSEGLSSFDLTQDFLSEESPASRHFWTTINKNYFIPQLMRQRWGKQDVAPQLLPTSHPPQKKPKGHTNMQAVHIHKKHQKRLQSLTLADTGGLCQQKLQAKAELTSATGFRVPGSSMALAEGTGSGFTSLAMAQSSFLLTVSRKASWGLLSIQPPVYSSCRTLYNFILIIHTILEHSIMTPW